MAAPSLTVQLPDPLYTRVAARAQRSNRPVEAEIVDMLESAIAGNDGLPADLASAIASMDLMTDDDLWRAAHSRLTAEAAERLEELHFRQQRAEVTAADRNEMDALTNQYEWALLIRANALERLKVRGHDISGLLAP